MSTQLATRRTAFDRGIVGWLVWSAAAAALVGVLVVEALLLGPTSCELAAGSSIYGDATWSWLPPGVACRWELEVGGDTTVITSAPSWARVGMLLLLAGWGAALRHRPATGGR
jgi:hypothetical protein